MRKAFLLLSTLIMSLGSACALDQGNGIDDLNPGLAVSDDDPDQTIQAPPIKLRLEAQQVPILSMIALRSSVGSYDGQMEHWFGAAGMGLTSTFIAPGDATLVVAPVDSETTEESIEAWASPFSLSFSTRREVRPEDWSEAILRTPEEGKGRLFMTTHPDDARQLFGVLVATDRAGDLALAGWYRSAPPGENGRAFDSMTFTKTMTLVVDANGDPSVDPNDYYRAEHWYSIKMSR